MFWILALMSLAVLMTIAAGAYFQFNPALARSGQPARWLTGALSLNALSFVGGLAALLLTALAAHAEPAAAESVKEISTGLGLAIIGIGIPTGIAALGAGLAVGPIGAAALAVIVEKPEAFGRSLIFIGLAEGIAIYGLVVTILLLDKI
jgi:V/A-type H+-transporting ATPase subunit K